MSSTVSPVIGRVLTASQIEAQVEDSLRLWFPTYLREIENQMGLPRSTFPAPENYSQRNALEGVEGEQYPKVVVISPGTIGSPKKKGDGTYTATWRLGVGVAVSAKTEDRADLLSKGYGAAVRVIMLQNNGLDNLNAADIAWTDEMYDDIPIPDRINLFKAASLYFNIDIPSVVTKGVGPILPNADPYVYGEFETVDIALTKEPLLEGG